jgi:hypothetical protein
MAAAVVGLISNGERRHEQVSRGAAVAHRFSVEACLRRHVDVYEQMAASPRRLAAVIG